MREVDAQRCSGHDDAMHTLDLEMSTNAAVLKPDLERFLSMRSRQR